MGLLIWNYTMIMVNAKSYFHRRYGELCFISVIILTNPVKHLRIYKSQLHALYHWSLKPLRGSVGIFYYCVDTVSEDPEAQGSLLGIVYYFPYLRLKSQIQSSFHYSTPQVFFSLFFIVPFKNSNLLKKIYMLCQVGTFVLWRETEDINFLKYLLLYNLVLI